MWLFVARSAMAIAIPASLLCATQAHAHFVLLYPPSRGVALESAPCGTAGSTRSSTVTVFRPGQTIVVQWNVQVDHLEPPKFRIALDDKGQDFPMPTGGVDTPPLPLFLDGVLTPGGGVQTKEVALPNIECDNCTLQMLQYLVPKPPYARDNFYYQCADITLSSSAPDVVDAAVRDAAEEAVASDPDSGASDASDVQGAPPEKETSDAGGPSRPETGGPSAVMGAAGCGYAGNARASRYPPVLVTALFTVVLTRRGRRGRSSR